MLIGGILYYHIVLHSPNTHFVETSYHKLMLERFLNNLYLSAGKVLNLLKLVRKQKRVYPVQYLYTNNTCLMLQKAADI